MPSLLHFYAAAQVPNSFRCVKKTTVGSRLTDTSTVTTKGQKVNPLHDALRLVRIQRIPLLHSLEKRLPPGRRKTSGNIWELGLVFNPLFTPFAKHYSTGRSLPRGNNVRYLLYESYPAPKLSRHDRVEHRIVRDGPGLFWGTLNGFSGTNLAAVFSILSKIPT